MRACAGEGLVKSDLGENRIPSHLRVKDRLVGRGPSPF